MSDQIVIAGMDCQVGRLANVRAFFQARTGGELWSIDQPLKLTATVRESLQEVVRSDGFPGEHLIVLNPVQRQSLKDNPLSRHLYFTDIGHFPRATNHFVDRKHGCEEFVIQFCLEGTGFCSFGGYRVPIEANQYFVLPAHLHHTYGSEEGAEWKVAWIHFSGEAAAELGLHFL